MSIIFYWIIIERDRVTFYYGEFETFFGKVGFAEFEVAYFANIYASLNFRGCDHYYSKYNLVQELTSILFLYIVTTITFEEV